MDDSLQCPICYEVVVAFLRIVHVNNCKKCHHMMIDHKHTTCPLCRESIHLNRRPKPHNEYGMAVGRRISGYTVEKQEMDEANDMEEIE